MPDPNPPTPDTAIQEMAKAAEHGNRQAGAFAAVVRGREYAWDIETGTEVGDCGHRHKVSSGEARNCVGLDRFEPIEVVTIRRDELARLLRELAAYHKFHEAIHPKIGFLRAEWGPPKEHADAISEAFQVLHEERTAAADA